MCVFINLLRTCNRSGFPSQTRARMHFERTRAIPIGIFGAFDRVMDVAPTWLILMAFWPPIAAQIQHVSSSSSSFVFLFLTSSSSSFCSSFSLSSERHHQQQHPQGDRGFGYYHSLHGLILLYDPVFICFELLIILYRFLVYLGLWLMKEKRAELVSLLKCSEG